MKRWNVFATAALAMLVLAASTTWMACRRPSGRPAAHAALRADGEPLRADFNAAAGRVRLVVLVSPT